MDWLNLRRLKPHFLINCLANRLADWCLGNWLIDATDFRGWRLLAFDGRAELRRQGGNRASRRIGRRRRNGGYCAGGRA
jgi:hypothetical protein